MVLRPEFFDVYLDLALEFGLPVRMIGSGAQEQLGFPAREVAADAGVLFTDQLVAPPGVGGRAVVEGFLPLLEPGVTEICLRPAVDSPELRSLAADWESRVDDRELVVEGTLGQAVEKAGAVLIGYRPLRDLVRAGG